MSSFARTDFPRTIHMILFLMPLIFRLIYCHIIKNVKKAFQKGQRTLFVSYELKDNQLIITITDRFVKLIHKKRINIGLSDWGRYYFEYSCEHEIWELIETQYGGV